jgi:hypothetical protein
MTRLAILATILSALIIGAGRADTTPPLLVQAEAQTLSPVCTGRDLQIEGNHNVIKPFGRCLSLLVKGVANQVDLELAAGGTIRVEGSDNKITYRAPAAAETTLLGDNSTATLQAAPTNEPATILALSGDDQALATDCTGRAVTVDGHRALYVLRGGCKSLTIHGDLVTVQAELLPSAAITVTGHGNRVGWALDHPGRPPATALHGEANHVERLSEIGGRPAP